MAPMSGSETTLRKLAVLTAGLGVLAFMLLAVLVTTSTSGYAASKATTAVAARLGGDAKRTRFVTDFSQSVEYTVKVLSNPFRVIVDLPEVDFNFPPGLGRKGQGLVKAYRYGQFGEGKSRIVLDIAAPVLVSKSFVIEARGDQPARLVIDLVRTDMATFAQTQETESKKDQPATARAEKIAALLQRMVDAKPEPIRPPVKPRTKPAKVIAKLTPGQPAVPPLPGDKPKPKKKRAGKAVIIIDPGHGGVDPGALGKRGTAEKSVTLAFSRSLRDELVKSGQYVVHMTRDSDRFIRLRDRVRIARNKNADLFISVHADSLRRGQARGATIYTLSEKASDKEAAALAAQENRADLIAGVALEKESTAVKGILIDLAQRETKNHSVFFAKQMISRFRRVTQVRKRPHRQAGFAVLTAPDVPSILIELGFLSNLHDEKNLRSKKWRQKVAVATKKAIDRYFSTSLAQRY